MNSAPCLPLIIQAFIRFHYPGIDREDVLKAAQQIEAQEAAHPGLQTWYFWKKLE